MSSSETGRVTVQSTSKIVHSSYNSQTLANDIALVRLPSAVSLSSKYDVFKPWGQFKTAIQNFFDKETLGDGLP